MKRLHIFAAIAVIGLLAGCSSPTPQDKAADADAQLKAKRMQLADEYQACTTKAAALRQPSRKAREMKWPLQIRSRCHSATRS